jgi:hypothetical protein
VAGSPSLQHGGQRWAAVDAHILPSERRWPDALELELTLLSTLAGDSGGVLELTLLSPPLRAALAVACSRRIARLKSLLFLRPCLLLWYFHPQKIREYVGIWCLPNTLKSPQILFPKNTLS